VQLRGRKNIILFVQECIFSLQKFYYYSIIFNLIFCCFGVGQLSFVSFIFVWESRFRNLDFVGSLISSNLSCVSSLLGYCVSEIHILQVRLQPAIFRVFRPYPGISFQEFKFCKFDYNQQSFVCFIFD